MIQSVGIKNFKSVVELHADITKRMKELIKPEILNVYGKRIFFAISIHTIECWLLPFYYMNIHKSNTTSCMVKLNSAITRKNINPITASGKNSPQSIRSYDAILKNWKKKENVIASSVHNYGFKYFVQSLNKLA